MNLLLAFIAFNFIIIIHELGHFLVAKAVGIKVLEFSLFIGPKLFSIQRGETTYSIRLLPIIAYVKMEGEEEASESERSFNKKPVLARAAVIAAGPLANLLTALIILTIVFSVNGFQTTEIDAVQNNSPAAGIGIQEGDKIVEYDNKKVYQPMDLVQFLYVSKGKPAEVVIDRGGNRITKTINPQVIPEKKYYMLGYTALEAQGPNSAVVGGLAKDSAAAKAGLKIKDKIIRINDTPINSRQDVSDFLSKNKEKPVKVTVLRDGSEHILNVTPTMGKTPEQYNIGIGFKIEEGNLAGAAKHSFVFTYSTAKSVGYTVYWLVTGQAALNQMMGPVGIFNTISDVVENSVSLRDIFINLLHITAYISIAIGATNLIPFPALDGNKLLLLGIEAIRRKPLPVEKEAYISMVGFVLLIMLAVYTVYNDILRVFTGG
ncbi:MAG: RIP metalloprotease RseP [Clostridia bacterium]|nr:RIP metalloprotease RseP [Clostridia bacterium]